MGCLPPREADGLSLSRRRRPTRCGCCQGHAFVAVGKASDRSFAVEEQSNSGTQTEGKAYQETWLLLEFCDRGSLQDAMDRGAFRAVRLGASESKVRVLCRSTRASAAAVAVHYWGRMHGGAAARLRQPPPSAVHTEMHCARYRQTLRRSPRRRARSLPGWRTCTQTTSCTAT